MKLSITLVVALVCSVATVTAGDRPAAKTAFDKGVKAFDEAKYQEALDAFEKAIELDPDFAEAYRERGFLYGMQRKNEAAYADVAKAMKLAPKDGANYLNRAMLHINLEKDYSKAIEDLDQAIKLDPKNPKSFNVRGYARMMLRKYKEAIPDLKEVVRLNPKFGNGNPHQHLGDCLSSVGEYEEALQNYEQVFKLDKKPSSRLYYTTGECLYQLKKYQRTIEMMSKVLELCPENEPRPNRMDAHLYIGDSHLVLGADAKALESYDQALKIDSKDGAAHYRRGLALRNLKRTAEAEKSFEQASELGYKP